MSLKKENKSPKNDIELNKQIIELMNLIKAHIGRLNHSSQKNDSITLNEMFIFWKSVFKQGEEP